MTVPVCDGLGAGLHLTVDPRYETDYVDGLYETALQKCLAASLGCGQVLYDIGAHIGFISLVGARLVGLDGKVFAFEADPVNASRISHHAELNRLPQIEVVRSAVWSECTSLAFQRDSGSSSRNRGTVAGVAEKKQAAEIISVSAITVDSFALEHLPPAVIKIDVEGAESEVLKGADRVAREVKPIMICEIHNANAAAYVLNWLAERGYLWKWLEGADSFPRCLVAQASC